MARKISKKLNCKEIEKEIPDFIANRMKSDRLHAFLEHVDHCENCLEELSIQFLVTIGIEHLEDGSTFDLQDEIQARMDAVRKRERIFFRLQLLGIFLECVIAIAIVVLIVLLIL